MKRVLTSVVLLTLLTGCGTDSIHNYEEDIKGVYFHEANKYTVLIQKASGEVEFRLLPHSRRVRLLLSDRSYVKCNYTRSNWDNEETGGCEIHITSVSNITGADWNHGKFGRGKTTKVGE